MFFNNKFNTFFGLNFTLVYTFPMCMVWRFHFPIRKYDFNPVHDKASGFIESQVESCQDFGATEVLLLLLFLHVAPDESVGKLLELPVVPEGSPVEVGRS